MSQPDTAIDNILGLNLERTDEQPPLPKQRKRINNLNESHFLTIKGLHYIKKNQPTLRKKLNHKDDYKNLTNFLNFYQLWGHSIYPKANFKDFLEMTIKVGGKSTQIKALRNKWIQEEMIKEQEDLAIHLPGLANHGFNDGEGDDGDEDRNGGKNQDNGHIENTDLRRESNDEDDDYDGLFTQRRQRNRLFVGEEESDDELYSVPKKKNDEISKESQDKIGGNGNEGVKSDIYEENKPISQKKTDDDFDDFEDGFDDDLNDLLNDPVPTAKSITHDTPASIPTHASGITTQQTQETPEEDPDAIMKEMAVQQQDDYDEDDYEFQMMREAGF